MSGFTYNAEYKGEDHQVRVNLLLIHFVDRDGIDIIYSPHLDLSGYGHGVDAAKKSFEIALEDFVDYTIKKNTIGKVLAQLGWELKGRTKRPKKVIAPSITSIISHNDYVSEIFDTYPVNTYHKEVQIPAIA